MLERARERADGVGIRLAERRDAAGIQTVYNHYVTESTALFDMVPRTLDEQVQWLDEHSGGHPALVAERAGAVVGFGSLSPFRSRPAYATTVEDSVYLLEEHQGLGIGRQLLDELIRLAAAHGFHAVIARITGENEASIGLHAACGFELVGTEREVGRKFGRWLDVVEMQRML
jgi:phosphinothricin acetyltransferase